MNALCRVVCNCYLKGFLPKSLSKRAAQIKMGAAFRASDRTDGAFNSAIAANSLRKPIQRWAWLGATFRCVHGRRVGKRKGVEDNLRSFDAIGFGIGVGDKGGRRRNIKAQRQIPAFNTADQLLFKGMLGHVGKIAQMIIFGIEGKLGLVMAGSVCCRRQSRNIMGNVEVSWMPARGPDEARYRRSVGKIAREFGFPAKFYGSSCERANGSLIKECRL